MFSGGLAATIITGLVATVSLSSGDGSAVEIQRLSSEATQVQVGEPFQVEVVVDAHIPINAVTLGVIFPENRVTIEQLRDGESVLTIWTEEPTINTGAVFLEGGTFRRGFEGEHRIINMTAVAKKAGPFSFRVNELQLLAGDGDGTDIEISAADVDPLRLVAVTEVAQETSVGSVSGDLSGDGVISMADISIFMSRWTTGDRGTDLNGDGRTSLRDFSILLAQYFRAQ
jgi:hypothetical protein